MLAWISVDVSLFKYLIYTLEIDYEFYFAIEGYIVYKLIQIWRIYIPLVINESSWTS